MNTLDGWDGPDYLADGVYRYSKYISWIRLYIDVEGGEFFGGTCGAASNLEVVREDGRWMRFETDPAATPAGEPVLRLRGYSTWDVVFERISEGVSLDEKIDSLEDLAVYLERCFAG